jgi:hypothetical protein
MDKRWNRPDEMTLPWVLLALLYAIVLIGSVPAFMYLVAKDKEATQPHVAEFYCTQENVGKVYSVYSNYPFVDVKEEEIEKPF